MKKPTTILCLFFLIATNIFSQNTENLKSNFRIVINEKITTLFETYNDVQQKKVNVFKIQLFHHENRNYTWKMKNKYQELYPNKKTDFFYESPYFKVTTEYFMTKISAQEKMDSIKKDFPDSFIIELPIRLKEL